MITPAKDEGKSYIAWGHSTLVSPWGNVRAKAHTGEEIVLGEVNLDYLKQIRWQIPITLQRRDDLYKVAKGK